MLIKEAVKGEKEFEDLQMFPLGDFLVSYVIYSRKIKNTIPYKKTLSTKQLSCSKTSFKYSKVKAQRRDKGIRGTKIEDLKSALKIINLF